jgi:hypothetical protein
VIATLPFIDRIDTSQATAAPDDPSCGGSDHSVWYAYTPPEDVTIEATTVGSRYDTTLSAWTGTRGDLERIACNDDTPEGLHSRIVFRASAGTTYYLMAAAFETHGGGLLTLSVYETGPSPANDDFDDATPVSSLPFSSELDTAAATRDADDPDCFNAGATVWYSLTPARSMLVEANTFGSDFDTVLCAWVGERGELRPRGSNDDRADSTQSQLLFVARAGVTHHLMVGSFGGAIGGPLRLSMQELERTAGGFACPTEIWLFRDVSEASVHANAIRCAIYLEVVRGREDLRFLPGHGVRRDQMAALLARVLVAADLPLPEPAHDFSDIRGNVHEDEIARLAAAGIVLGTMSATYEPGRAVTREQVASYLVRTLEWVVGDELTAPRSPFVDIAGRVHRGAIDVAYDQGLTVGRTADEYVPRAKVRRDEAATFTIRLLGSIVDELT